MNPYTNQAQSCVLCGEVGEVLHWTGWYCAGHAALPLDEKVRRWQQGQRNNDREDDASAAGE